MKQVVVIVAGALVACGPGSATAPPAAKTASPSPSEPAASEPAAATAEPSLSSPWIAAVTNKRLPGRLPCSTRTGIDIALRS